MKIYTHFFVDLDAVCSVWAARQFIPGAKDAVAESRPANWDGKDMAENDLALDIPAGGRGMKGEKGEGGIVHSCVALIVAKYASPADQSALASLVRFVDAQDAHGSAVKFLAPEASRESQETLAMTGLNAVLRALQATHPRNDALVCERMSEILSGMLQAGRARQRAAAEADKAEILDGGKVAIVVNSREFATNGVLFEERGVRVIIYVDGHNLGLIREGSETLRMDHPEFCAVAEAEGEASEWFAHSAGFLYCRGSRKAPAESSSRVNPRVLAEVAARLLKQ
ncbi:MAG: hypothetical protein AAB579_02930 [Patescibacteria group bacterium]